MSSIHCTTCYSPYPSDALPYRCAKCGGMYGYREFPAYDPAQVDPSQPSMWKYRHAFGLPPHVDATTLGEGDTTLTWADVKGRKIAFKQEYDNPSGSQKDRGVSLLVSWLKSMGVKQAVEDSSGNAGASFATYAQKFGIQSRIFIPDAASGPKRQQIDATGAQVIRILGRRSVVAEAVQRAAGGEVVYASHAYLPHLLPGYATISYELVEQMETPPKTVIAPVGHGSLLLGVAEGFRSLKRAGVIDTLPHLIGVQALNCAPLWAAFTHGMDGLSMVTEGETVAEGVRVLSPLAGDALMQAVANSGGRFIAVPEDDILPGRDQLHQIGFNVEPTSALVWHALQQVLGRVPEPIAVLLTGAGWKSTV